MHAPHHNSSEYDASIPQQRRSQYTHLFRVLFLVARICDRKLAVRIAGLVYVLHVLVLKSSLSTLPVPPEQLLELSILDT